MSATTSEIIKIGRKLKSFTFFEGIFINILISEKNSDESIIDHIKGLRLGMRIENLTSILREAGYSACQIEDLVEEHISDLLSTKEIKKISAAIKSSGSAR